MSEIDADSTYVTLESACPNELPTLQFYSPSELDAWAKSEAEFWLELALDVFDHPVASILGIGPAIRAFEAICEGMSQKLERSTLEARARDAADKIGWYLPGHPIRQLLEVLRRDGETPPVLAVMYLLLRKLEGFRRYANEPQYVVDVATAAAHLAIYRSKIQPGILQQYAESAEKFGSPKGCVEQELPKGQCFSGRKVISVDRNRFRKLAKSAATGPHDTPSAVA
jgi:hypothetical protein